MRLHYKERRKRPRFDAFTEELVPAVGVALHRFPWLQGLNAREQSIA